jgi:hypothetical protein
MQKCSYCGRDNEDDAQSCKECGTPLAEEQQHFKSPHRSFAEAQQALWDYVAVKRGRIYLAGFLIGALGGLYAALREIPDHGFIYWAPIAGGAVGVSAVGLLTFAEKLQVKIRSYRAEGNPTAGLQLFFVLTCLFGLLLLALAVAVLVSHFL